MKIEYANHHSWFKPVATEPMRNYGSSDQKRLRKALAQASELGISHEFEPAAPEFYEWFVPMYTSSISSKNNPKLANVYEMTLGNPHSKYNLFTLTLRERGVPVGGCIFSDRGTHYSISYRIYQSNWQQDTKIASPAFYGEYLLDAHSLENQKEKLVHGQDRNPYGVNSAIGLAIFKLAVGCSAKLPPTHERLTLDTDSVEVDTLVLHYPASEKQITEATLIAIPDTIQRYQQLFTYDERLHINVTERTPS